jgi:hypothetical protein
MTIKLVVILLRYARGTTGSSARATSTAFLCAHVHFLPCSAPSLIRVRVTPRNVCSVDCTRTSGAIGPHRSPLDTALVSPRTSDGDTDMRYTASSGGN